jgi:hypothetical protein
VTTLESALQHARSVADAVLYEGYLLYPYRATSGKNRVRWQFGVLGPPGAAAASLGEESTMSADCLTRSGPAASVTIHVRFLQLQTRGAEAVDNGGFRPVDSLVAGTARWLTWDEAVECEEVLGPIALADTGASRHLAISVPAGRTVEHVHDEEGVLVGRLVRERVELSAALTVEATPVSTMGAEAAGGEGLVRLSVRLDNTGPSATDKVDAIAHSFIGTHLLLEITAGEFVSTVDPPPDAAAAAAACGQQRWWPALAGPRGSAEVLLVTPIIVEDHAERAPESSVALFDATEIDEILTLRVMTMTDAEKAEARATDPRAAEIIDRCDAMTPEELQRLHGVLRNPHGMGGLPAADDVAPLDLFTQPMLEDPFASPIEVGGTDRFSVPDPFLTPGDYDLPDALTWTDDAPPIAAGEGDHPVFTADAPWWDPAADATVSPSTDSVVISGVVVRKGSVVTVQPHRRADAQDIFFRGMRATVAAVLHDVDGDTHVAVTLVDDPAAEMHDWYGRYLYFAPDELVPSESVPAVGTDLPTEGDPP